MEVAPLHHLGHDDDQTQDCVICCLELNGKDQTATECCSNDLHIACLFQWLSGQGQSQTCPFCRHQFSEAYKNVLKVNNSVVRAINSRLNFPTQTILVGLFNGELYPLGLIAQSPFRQSTRYLLVSGDQSLHFKVTGAKYSYFEAPTMYAVEGQPQIGKFMLELSHSDNDAIVALETQLKRKIKEVILPGSSLTQRSNTHLDLMRITVNDQRPYISVKESYQGHYQNEIRDYDANKILHKGIGDFIFHLRVLKMSQGIFVTPCAISAHLKPLLKSQFTPIGSGKCFL